MEPGLAKRIKRTAFLRSLVRPDKKAYRAAAKVATGEAFEYAQAHCMNYFEFQFKWVEIMVQTENEQVLQAALVQAAIARQAGEEVVISTAESPMTSLDPGLTGQIQLDIDDLE